MTDTSGINTDAYQADLQAAADQLVSVFPKEFKSDFKVYDFGFYLHDESYSGGYPEAFTQAIADVSAKSPYYLLFGKQTDHSGVYTKFWVDLKLPTTDSLSCLPEELMGFISNQALKATSAKYQESGNSAQEYHLAEKAGMEWLATFVSDKINCCKGLEDYNYCSSCVWEQDMVELLLLNGYSLAEVSNVNVDTTFIDTSGVFKQYAKISGTLGDSTFNFNDDLLPFITELAEIDGSITGRIRYYESTNCREIAASITGNSIVQNAAKPNDDAENESENYLIYDVIVFEYEGKHVIATNYQTNWFDFSLVGNHTFYLYGSEDIPWPMSMKGVKDSLQLFFNLAKIDEVNIEVPNKVSKFYGYTDGVLFVTKHRSYIKSFINSYPYTLGIQESNGNIKEILDNYLGHTNPEYTFHHYIGIVSLDKTGNGFSENNFDDGNNYNRVYLSNGETNYNRIVAFIALHVTTHQAGYLHHTSGGYDDAYDEGRGYGWSGNYMSYYLETGYIRDYEKGLISSPLDNIYDLPNTFEDLIVLTRKYFPFMAGFITMRYTAGVIMGNQKTWDE